MLVEAYFESVTDSGKKTYELAAAITNKTGNYRLEIFSGDNYRSVVITARRVGYFEPTEHFGGQSAFMPSKGKKDYVVNIAVGKKAPFELHVHHPGATQDTLWVGTVQKPRNFRAIVLNPNDTYWCCDTGAVGQNVELLYFIRNGGTEGAPVLRTLSQRLLNADRDTVTIAF